jgi:hypothetical protein
MRVGFALLVFVLFAEPVAAAPWITFSDPTGRFTIMFPGAPTAVATRQKIATGDSIPVAQYLFDADRHQVGMVFMDADFSALNVDPEAVLDSVESALHGDKYTLLSSGPDTLDGRTGLKIVVLDKTGVRITDRLFVFGGHMYQALAGVSPSAASSVIADADRYVDSLHFSQAVSQATLPATVIGVGVVDASCLTPIPRNSGGGTYALADPLRPTMLAAREACTLLQSLPSPASQTH